MKSKLSRIMCICEIAGGLLLGIAGIVFVVKGNAQVGIPGIIGGILLSIYSAKTLAKLKTPNTT